MDIIILIAFLVAIGFISYLAHKMGKMHSDLEQEKRNAKALREMLDIAHSGPVSPDDALDRMRNGDL